MNTSDTLRTVPGTWPTLTEHKLLTHPAPATVGLHPTTVFYPLLCTFHTAYTLYSTQVSLPQRGLSWSPYFKQLLSPLFALIFPHSTCHCLLFYLFIYLLFLSLKCKIHTSRDFVFFHVCLPHLKQCLASRRPFTLFTLPSNTMIHHQHGKLFQDYLSLHIKLPWVWSAFAMQSC